jgi:hypothetical protein
MPEELSWNKAVAALPHLVLYEDSHTAGGGAALIKSVGSIDGDVHTAGGAAVPVSPVSSIGHMFLIFSRGFIRALFCFHSVRLLLWHDTFSFTTGPTEMPHNAPAKP